jgi:hypothetical protein
MTVVVEAIVIVGYCFTMKLPLKDQLDQRVEEAR